MTNFLFSFAMGWGFTNLILMYHYWGKSKIHAVIGCGFSAVFALLFAGLVR